MRISSGSSTATRSRSRVPAGGRRASTPGVEYGGASVTRSSVLAGRTEAPPASVTGSGRGRADGEYGERPVGAGRRHLTCRRAIDVVVVGERRLDRELRQD